MFATGLSMSFFSMFSVMIVAGGLSGLPMGLPPAEPDARMSRVAPEECLLYVSWSGMAEPSADSANHTERLLAEPEVQRFIKEVTDRLTTALKQGAGQGENARRVADITPKILKQIAVNPTAFFAGKFGSGPAGMTVPVGLVVKVGEGVGEFENDLLTILEILTDAPVPDAVDGVRTLITPPGIPKIQWIVSDGYFILGVSEGTVAQIQERMAGSSSPEWLAAVHKRLPVDRVASVTFINTKEIMAAAQPFLAPLLMSRGPDAGNPLDALGLTNLESVVNVTGLGETNTVSRTWFNVNGKPTGMLAMFDAEPLKADDFAEIPADSTIAVSLKLDPVKTLDRLISLIDLFEPGASQQVRRQLQQIDGEIGFSITGDLLGSLGDSWSVYHSPSEGGAVFTGWTAVAEARNPEALRAVTTTIFEQVNQFEEMQKARGGRLNMVGVRTMTVGSNAVHFLNFIGEESPVAPAWCVTDKHLVISLFPQGVAAFLNREEGTKTLASLPHIQQALAADRPPVSLVHVDSKTVCRSVYPLALIGANFLFSELQREGVDLNISVMPDGETITKHLQPALTTVTSGEDGIEVVSTRTLPVSIGTGSTILPSILMLGTSRSGMTRFGQSTSTGLLDVLSPRRAQRSQATNNLKQLGIAMHNFHDAFRSFPSTAEKDKDGKPLLSWRVRLLPFIDQGPLFKKFHMDEAWDSPHNKELIKHIPPIYRTPGSKAAAGKTNYVGLRHEKAIFHDGEGTRIRDIRDGTSNTIMIVEADDDHAVIWTKPDDLEFDEKKPHAGLGKLRKDGFLAAMCDGSAHFIPSTITPATLVKLVFRNDGQPIDFNEFRAGAIRQRRHASDAVAAEPESLEAAQE
ncbi:MAG: hypothetical protein ACI8P0_002949 [Planctomycetaceae bacterium]|jgi:hypothetical protein